MPPLGEIREQQSIPISITFNTGTRKNLQGIQQRRDGLVYGAARLAERCPIKFQSANRP
jgi:hypothetical protein